MREILFRGKRVDNGEWVYSSFIMQDKEHKLLLAEVELFDGEKWRAVDPETVGQFIGLTDKNGTKIFEGDIIRTSGYYDKEIGVIRRCEYDVYSRLVFGGYYCVAKTYALIDWTSSRGCEVIGNIYDNFKLLQEGKQ